MNRTYLYIAGILLVAAIGSTALIMRVSSDAPQHVSTEAIVYFDNISGQHNAASITYTSYNPVFNEKTISLDTNKNETPDNVDIISYNIESKKQDDIFITINKNKNLISLKGLAPREKISVIQNSKYVMSNIPSDWSGKLTLNKDNLEISKNLCFELIVQNITACHAVTQNKGGVS